MSGYSASGSAGALAQTIKGTNMMLDPRHGAENLFRPPDAVAGSDAEKLQKLRERLQLRKRELRLQEKQSRDDTRQERIAASRIPVDAKRTPTADGLSPRSGFWK